MLEDERRYEERSAGKRLCWRHREGKNRRDDIEPKTRTAPGDDRNKWMQKVVVEDAASTEDMGSRYIRGVTLWAKRAIDDHDVKLRTAGRERLQLVGLKRERIETK